MEARLHTLIAKKFSGNASTDELGELDALLASNAAYAAEYERLQQVWHESYALKSNAQHNVAKAWDEFKELAARQKNQRKRGLFLRVAASLAAVIVVGALVAYLLPKTDSRSSASLNTVPKTNAAQAVHDSLPQDTAQLLAQDNNPVARPNKPARKKEFHVVAGDTAIVFLLPDSTTVYLNRYSGLTYSADFGKKERKLELTGEAYFEVKHLPTPFVVYCGHTVTRDIGTAFNIKGSYNDSLVEVSVLSGSVVFYQKERELNSTVLLTEGGGAVFNPTTAHIEKTRVKKSAKWWKAKGIKSRLREFIDKFTHRKS